MIWSSANVWNRLSIRAKLSVMYLVTTLFLLGAVFTALSFNEHWRLRQSLASELLTLAHMLGIHSSASLSFDDVETATMLLASLRTRPNVVCAYFFKEDGNRLASYHRNGDRDTQPRHLASYHLERNAGGHLADRLSQGIVRQGEVIEVFRYVEYEGHVTGTIYIQSDLEELVWREYVFMLTLGSVLLLTLLLSLPLQRYLQRVFTVPVISLMHTILRVSKQQNFSLRAKKHAEDEVGNLASGFNMLLDTLQQRDQQILGLNEKLRVENQRLGAELNAGRKMQHLVLPSYQELAQVADLQVSAYMEPADEVGGDYYDVLSDADGRVKIGIGDVTGHGLESGMVMLMVQMAVRTLFNQGVSDPREFMQVLNQTLYDNFQRMHSDKNLTLALLDYYQGRVALYGQHEEILIFRANGQCQRLDTFEFGFMVGLLPDIHPYVQAYELELQSGDGIVLYTDGITEARNSSGKMYGLERLCQVAGEHWQANAHQVKEAILADVWEFIDKDSIADDISLMVLVRN